MKTLALPPGVRLIQPPGRPFWVLESQQTLILDWDIEDGETLLPLTAKTEPTRIEAAADISAESGCCTINCTEDAVALLEPYAEQYKDQLWAVYKTGKGVRAFRLDKDFPTNHSEVNALTGSLRPDPKYLSASIEREHWAARVSHKAGRLNETIQFLQWIGTGTVMSNQWAVLHLHHKLLLEHQLTTVPFNELVEALEAHLNSPKQDCSRFQEPDCLNF